MFRDNASRVSLLLKNVNLLLKIPPFTPDNNIRLLSTRPFQKPKVAPRLVPRSEPKPHLTNF